MQGMPMSRVAPGGTADARVDSVSVSSGVRVAAVIVSVLSRAARVSSEARSSSRGGGVMMGCSGASGAVNTVCMSVTMSSSSSGNSVGGAEGVFSLSMSVLARSFPISTRPRRGEGDGEVFRLPFFSTTFFTDRFGATGVVRPADGSRLAADAGLILAASLSGWRTGVRVEVMETPDATRARTIGAGAGVLDVVPFLAVVPTVRVLAVDIVEPPDVLRDRAPLDPAEVGVSSEGAVRNVESDVAEERLELGRGTEEGMRRVDRPF